MVPHHMAPGVDATPARARVLALLVETGLILSAVGPEDTLRPAVWGCAKIAGKTGAHAAAAHVALGAEGSTEVPRAGIPLVFNWLFNGCHLKLC